MTGPLNIMVSYKPHTLLLRVSHGTTVLPLGGVTETVVCGADCGGQALCGVVMVVSCRW